MNPSPLHPNAPPSLFAWLAGLDAVREPAIREVSLDGIRCVVKRRRTNVSSGIVYGLRYIRALLLGLGCKLFMGEFPKPHVVLQNGLAHEGQRLIALRQAGCKVPEVWWQAPGLLVLEYVGEDLADLIRKEDDAQRRWLTLALAEDLALFHRKGLWHGGAQIRNITLRDGALWRIDFEENIGAALSRPITQAYDLFQMLASLVSLRNLPDPVARTLGALALDVYFQHNPDDGVKQGLRRIARVLYLMAKPLRPILSRIAARDVQGFLRVVDILQPFYSSHEHTA